MSWVFFRPNGSLCIETSDCRHRGNLNTMELEMLVDEANARQAKNKKRSPHVGREVQWLENKRKKSSKWRGGGATVVTSPALQTPSTRISFSFCDGCNAHSEWRQLLLVFLPALLETNEANAVAQPLFTTTNQMKPFQTGSSLSAPPPNTLLRCFTTACQRHRSLHRSLHLQPPPAASGGLLCVSHHSSQSLLTI